MNNYPFRLGTTSYIIPADILSNVQYLAGKVEDVELVLFEVDDGPNNLPHREQILDLKKIAAESNLTYTVHLPLDTQLGCEDEQTRIRSVNKCLRVMERMVPVKPFGWIRRMRIILATMECFYCGQGAWRRR